jgi:uncharacterized FlaG/YvyC family protein
MEDKERIQELEGEIFDLKSELKEGIDRERIYREILSEIDDSIINLLQRDKENERFRFDEKIDFKEYVINVKKDLDEYRRIYGNISF